MTTRVLNTIQFRAILEPENGDEWIPTARILVDGRELGMQFQIEDQQLSLRDGESPCGGGYRGIDLEDGCAPVHAFLGQETCTWDDEGRTAILACGGMAGCGEPICKGIAARIECGPTLVTWSDFAHTVRDHWRYPEIGPFTFDRAQYEAALHDLATQVPIRREW